MRMCFATAEMSETMIEAALPFITVVMPVLNEARFIEKTLCELVAQEYPKDRYEVIVADGGSSDGTQEIVRDIAAIHPQVILMDNPGRLPSSGRNVGFKKGKGEFFLVIDGHCEIRNPQLLSNVVDCFQRSGAHCLGRPQPFIVPEEPSMQRAIGLARSSWLGHSSKSFIHSNQEGFVSPTSVGCAYRREVFDKIGYVDETFDACEDVEFNYRVEKAGFKTFFSPLIRVYYYPRSTLQNLWKQMVRYGKGRLNFAIKHPPSASFEMIIPPGFVLWMVAGSAIGAFLPSFFLLYILSMITYLVVSVTALPITCTHYKCDFFLNFIAALFVIHCGIGVGMIHESMLKIRTLVVHSNIFYKTII